MFSLKKNVVTLILILLVYGWFFVFQTNTHTASLDVLGANANISLFVQPDAGKQPILNAINNALSEVLVQVYLLSDKDVINSLELARNRGVSVRVMLEEHPFGGGGLNNDTKSELESSGVSVKWANPKFALTHEKAIVVDGSIAFILNQNLTTSSFAKNREYDIVDTNPEDVLQIRNIFVSDWERKPFTPSSTHLIQSPENSRAAITGLIKQAQNTIDIEMEVVADNEMITLLSEKAKNTTIRILAPPISQINSNKDGLMALKNSGILVKTLSSPYVHAKLILVDKVKAYIGSVNLSTQSMDKNRELGIMLTQSDIINNLNFVFVKDWDKGRDYNSK